MIDFVTFFTQIFSINFLLNILLYNIYNITKKVLIEKERKIPKVHSVPESGLIYYEIFFSDFFQPQMLNYDDNHIMRLWKRTNLGSH
jgi:hypothetical protein